MSASRSQDILELVLFVILLVEKKIKMEDKRSLETQMGDQRLAEIYDTAVPAGKRLIESVLGTEPIGVGGEKIVYDYKDGKVVAQNMLNA